MSENSLVLSLPYLQPSQAQKHVTHNEALRQLDVVVQLTVASRTFAAPPAQPAEGDRHIVAAGASDVWSGRAGSIAILDQGLWQFIAPQTGWRAYVIAESAMIIFDGTQWAAAAPSMQNLPEVGIGTTADEGNRLSVASDAVLLSHAGSGHQLKINKAGAADTASLLFQTGFSGRAEMGLAGNDDFAVKVSADGATWTQALRIDGASGRVIAPAGGLREMLDGPRVYHVDPLTGDDANDGLAAGAGRAFAHLERALTAVRSVDAAGHAVVIRLADGVHDLAAPISLVGGLVGQERYVIEGNADTPSSVVLRAPGTLFDLREASLRLVGISLQSTGPDGYIIVARPYARVGIDRVDFGTAALGHVVLTHAVMQIEGDYSISADAPVHLLLDGLCYAEGRDKVVTLTNEPEFSAAFVVGQNNCLGELVGITYVGDAIGKRFALNRRAMLITNGGGVNYFPGSASGTTAGGSLYA